MSNLWKRVQPILDGTIPGIVVLVSKKAGPVSHEEQANEPYTWFHGLRLLPLMSS